MKPFWASKTLWVNGLALIAMIAGVFKLDIGLDAETQAQIIVGVMAVVNVILRLVTSTGVAMKTDAGLKSSGFVGVLMLALILTACAGSLETRSTNTLAIACDSYATALDQLTPLRADGKLTAVQIARVDAANAIVDPACSSGSVLDPGASIAAVRQGVELLTLMMKGTSP